MAARVLLDNWSQRTCGLKSLTATKFEVKFEIQCKLLLLVTFFHKLQASRKWKIECLFQQPKPETRPVALLT